MNVRWSFTAQEDLDRIRAFVADDNPNAADRLEDRLFAAAQSLEQFAHRGRPGRMSNTRELVVAHTAYLIIYTDDGGEMVILRVVHGHQLWPPAEGG